MNGKTSVSQKKYLGEPAQIRAAALRALDRRHYSAAGLRERLYWRLDPSRREDLAVFLDEIIAELEQKKLIDERQMVEAWCHYRREHMPRGRAYLRRELLQKGVRPEVIDSELTSSYDEQAEINVLERVFCKELAKLPTDEQRRERFWRNLVPRLARRGFSVEQVYALMNQYRDVSGRKFDD